MKRLTFLRHAKSSWDDLVPRDFDRPLNPKGRRAARTVGRHLRELGLHFDRVVASPAVRVSETLAEVALAFGEPLPAVCEHRLYLARAETILEVIRETPDSAESLLLAGHNPGLEEAVLALVPTGTEDLTRDKVQEKYPTASVAELLLPVAHWADLIAGEARLLRFTRPRDLDPTLGPDPEG